MIWKNYKKQIHLTELAIQQCHKQYLYFCNQTILKIQSEKAISIGGDTDTIACMVGSISEAYYGIPKDLRNKALKVMPEEMRKTIISAYEMKRQNETQKEIKNNIEERIEGL